MQLIQVDIERILRGNLYASVTLLKTEGKDSGQNRMEDVISASG